MEPPAKRLKRSECAAGSSNAASNVPVHLTPRPNHPPRTGETRRHPYSRDLLAHHGSVNALALSSPDGRWLVSGGDDKRVLLWDTFGDLTTAQPKATFTGPRANIFSCDMSCDGRRIMSGGLCATLFQWDLERPGAPLRADHHHVASIRGVTCHPTEPTVSLAASEDGTISCCDWRLPNGPQPILSERAEYVDVVFNPTSDHLFAAATSSSIQLFDRRRVSLMANPSDHSVQKYVSGMVRGRTFPVAGPEISSLAFDPSGGHLSAMMSRWYPTIWSVGEPFPVAVLQAPGEGGPAFRDSVTVKHGGFSFPKHSERLCFAAGSEDFTTYVWELPAGLEQDRRQFGFESWHTSSEDLRGVFAHCATPTGPRSIPTIVSSPVQRLHGHRSIPNSAAFHPTLPLIFTAGVEKTVKVHSSHPFGAEPSTPSARRTPAASSMATATRFGHLDNSDPDSSDDDDEEEEGAGPRRGPAGGRRRVRTEEELRAEDARTLRMFDELLEDEGARGRDYENEVWLVRSEASDESEGHLDFEDDGGSDVVYDRDD